MKMFLERNLVPQTLTHLHRRRERQNHVTKLISAEEHVDSPARNVNQTNQEERQSLVALFYILRLAFILAIKLA